MLLKFTVDIDNPSIGALAAVHMVRDTIPVEIKWSNECSMQYANGSIFECYHHNDGLRILAYTATEHKLYGTTLLESIQIDNWLTWCLKCDQNDSLVKLGDLNRWIATITYLVSNKITIADLALYHTIITNYRHLIADGGLPQHVQRWYNLINAQPFVQAALESLPEKAKANYKAFINKNRKAQQQQQRCLSNSVEEGQVEQVEETKTSTRKQEGKFIDLPGAEMGKVVVRFPPEASGYLHIGHAKAALLNQYYAQAFNGKLIMRFDDTNPAKETTEFEEVILGDLELLQIKPDAFTHTSNYFDVMLEYCEQLIKDGNAYVDDTSAEQMKIEREQKIESKNRSNDVEKNMSMWQEMLTATEYGQTCCVRAKIDMNSANGCMRDPTIYRCKNEPHPRTDTKYKVYPTYDFACPIVDALENVTHTLRTMEYHDRDEQFYWFIDALKLRKPYIWEYSRLNMTNTVLSKRKLTWFVENGLVDDWDDPRLPTVRGIIRRGMTVEGLKEFIIAQGSSKAVVFMNWDKIWAFNKKVIDPIAPRYTALEYENRIVVNVAGIQSMETVEVAIHPKNEALGKKTITVGPKVYIDYEDAQALKEAENATFINWGNLLIKKINKDPVSGRISSIDAALNLDNKDYKKTLKLTWIAVEEDDDVYPPTFCVYFDNIISKPVLGKDEDFKQYIDHTTREEVKMLGESAMKNCKKGDIIQLQRRGFFKVDNAYSAASPYSNAISPIILFSIPDGHTKQRPMSGLKINANITQNAQVGKVNKSVNANESIDTGKLIELNESIIQQGNLIRDLKSKNAAKNDIEANVKILLKLKSDYKELSGKEWKPGNTNLNSTVNKSNSLNSPSREVHTPTNKQQLNDRITSQGDKVRQLKAEKADKAVIDGEVKILLQLKAEYKEYTGNDWKPNISPKINAGNNLPATPIAIKHEKFPEKPSAAVVTELLNKIQQQADKIHQLKGNKADEASINPEEQLLLALIADYKSLTNEEWHPNIKPPVTIEPKNNKQFIDLTDDTTTTTANEISEQIKIQGDKVRKLKSEKAAKADIAIEVQHLLSLKAEYKSATGKDWVPETTPNREATSHETKSPTNMSTLSEKELLMQAINEQGEKVRNAKANKVDKADIDAAVAKLLALKAKYKEVTGTDYPVAGRSSSSSKKPTEKKEQKANKKDTESPATGSTKSEITSATPKKQTRLGLEATKEDNLPDWYSQVITKGELIEYYDVSGCYILRQWSFAIWKFIRNWFDNEITKMGVKECYFPIFVSKAALEREKAHIADFAPEVAWVTKSGESDLAEPIAVRPTSETVMYPAFAKWIQSYRDLPIRLNQWNNVVRWEFKHPQPFLRTREFLWQEGHTAFANKEDADKEVLDILDLYAQVYTDLLAIPVVKGRKTEKEKFAGSNYTTTVEAFISASGRGIQGATSHHLGQNFSKMFEIVYEDPDTQQKQYVYQNSWGITTRTIGVMIMVHADNQGIVLPPRVACIQAIIVPCGLTVNTKDTQRTELLDTCCKLEKLLIAAGIRCEGDYRDNYTPGWKFNHWELKGVPVRIELGPKDMEANQIVAVRRDTGEKLILAMDAVEIKLKQLLETIHDSMLARATDDLKTHTILTKNWSDFCKYLDQKNILLAPFCGEISCEEKIKANSAREEDAEPGAPSMGAKSLCIPFEQPAAICPSDKCIHPGCTNKPMSYTLFGRSY